MDVSYTKGIINITWCTVSIQEQQKCENFAKAVERDNIRVGFDYYRLSCKQVLLDL